MPRHAIAVATLGFVASLAAADPDITATFDDSAEGWSVYGDGESFLWDNAFGNGPGSIYAADGAHGSYWGFTAGPAFLGDRSHSVGGRLSWDLWVSGINNTDPDEPDVWLISSDLTLVYNTGDPPEAGAWVPRHALVTDFVGWRVDTLDGPYATAGDIIEVMSDLQEVRIRAEYRVGADQAWLDNAVLTSTLCYPDCNHDLRTDLFDFLCFVNSFNIGDEYSDCDANGEFDLFDFLCFTNSFNNPCV